MTLKKIAVSDSGVGGLFVLEKIFPFFSNIHWLYFADTAHFPYGPKSKDELLFCCSSIFEFMNSLSAEGILMACNSVSSLFTQDSLYKNKIPLIGIIQPTIDQTLEFSKKENKKRIGVLATQHTVQSNLYKEGLLKANPRLEVFQHYISEFPNLVENNQMESSHFKIVFKELLEWIDKQKLDALILGCTHYLILREKLQAYITTLDPLSKLPKILKETFELTKPGDSSSSKITFYSNQESSSFQNQVQKLFRTSTVHLVK